MVGLEVNTRTVTAEGFAPAVVVELTGSIDPGTIDEFTAIFDSLIAKSKTRIILDLYNLKYINSTGMGVTVQIVDTLQEAGGGLVFMRVQPKVLLVIEMLGLQELFHIVPSEKAALEALSSGEEEDIPSIEVQLDDDAAPGSTLVACGVCQAMLSVPSAGTYRCPRCRSALRVSEDGVVQAHRESGGTAFELTTPADNDYMNGITHIISMAGIKTGLEKDAAQAAAAAAEGCMRVLAKEALNGSAAEERLHLFISSENGQLTVRIYCGGKGLASTNSLDAYRGGVDSIEYKVTSGGNLITLEKDA